MNEKCLKTSVCVNDTVFCENLEQAVDIDFTLPDYCPDISKIFKCQAIPRISSKGINGKIVTIDGTVLLTLIYCDKNGRICSYEYQYPFSKNIEFSEDLNGVNLICKTRTEYINCRAVTGRKVDIHGAISIKVKAIRKKMTDVISDIDDNMIELNRSIAPATTPMGYAEKYVLVEEELHIGQGQPPIQNILRTDAKTCIKETKIVNDKAVVKGEMTVCILYCAENTQHLQTIKTVIPFSQIIDVIGINESCSCDTKSEVAFFEVKPKISQSGETKILALTSKILLTCEAYCNNEIPVVLDAFSRKFEAIASKDKVCFQKITHNLSETYHCKKSVTLENTVDSIVDLWCNVGVVSVKFENENLLIFGETTVCVIAANDKNDIFYFEKPIEFQYKHPINISESNAYCEPEIEIISCGFTLTSPENMEIRIDLGINAAIYECSEISLISDFAIDENKIQKRKSNCALVIYFCDKGEKVWDIARNYNASVEEIMNINDLKKDVMEETKMLLVPIM